MTQSALVPPLAPTAEMLPYWRLSAFYFFYFALIGTIMPYWGLYLLDIGYSAREIGLFTAAMMGTKMISPYLWGWLADRSGRRMSIIRLGALLGLLFFAVIFFGRGFYFMLAVLLSFSFFWNAVISQFEVVTLSHLPGRYEDYSRIRVWGSIGFIVAVVLLGWLFDVISIRWLPWVMLFMLAGIFFCSLLVRERLQARYENNEESFWDVARQPAVIAFFCACCLLQVSHGPYYAFFSVYLEGYGYTRPMIGGLWALGVIAEVVLFLAMHRLLVHIGLRGILLASLGISVLRWLLIAYFPEQLVSMVVAQLGHAATFGSFHAVAVELVRRFFAGHHQGKGQAVYSAVSFGLGGAIGASLSGFLWESDALLVWLVASFASLLALILVYVFMRDHPAVRM